MPTGAGAEEPVERRQYAVEGCVGEGTGDVRTLQRHRQGVVTGYPHADLVEYCFDYGQRLRVTARVVSPTDPSQDGHWRGLTGVLWELDRDGDEEADYLIEYWGDGQGQISTDVYRVDRDRLVHVCQGEGHFAGVYDARIDADCVRAPAVANIKVSVLYDTDPEDESSTVHIDHGPDAWWTYEPVERHRRRRQSRIDGTTPTERAVGISRRGFPDGADDVFLSRADELADAIAGGAVTSGPILYVPRCGELPQVVGDEVARLDPDRVIALGGPQAVCDDILEQAADAGREFPDWLLEPERETGRIAGEDRFATAAAISRTLFPDGAYSSYLVRADVYADAAVAGTLEGGPILLLPSCDAPPAATVDEIVRLDPRHLTGIGGTAAICDGTLGSLRDVGDKEHKVWRVAGADRYLTSVQVAELKTASTGWDEHDVVYIVPGTSLADAVAAGTLTDGPVLLTPACGDLPIHVKAEINSFEPSEIIALGDVCDRVLQQAAN